MAKTRWLVPFLAGLAAGMVLVASRDAISQGKSMKAAAPRHGGSTLTIDSCVMNFDHVQPNAEVTVKADLSGVTSSKLPSDFTIQLIITDNRAGGEEADSGDFNPDVIR